MLGHTAEECLALADAVLAAVPRGEAEVVVSENDLALTRFARNTIHQNVAETGLSLRLRLVDEGRVGVAELRGGGEGAIARLVQSAEEARRLAPAQEDLAPLPAPGGGDGPCGWSDATAAASPEQRAEGVAIVTEMAAARGLQAFGALSTQATQLAVVNTRGVRRHGRSTGASLTAVVRGDDGAGYADRHAVDAGELDAAAVAAEVIETAERNQGAAPVDPGEYQVVLAPYAVQEMVAYLSHIGFSALAVQERRSFMRRGERLMSPEVTIRDDAADLRLRPFPFDAEGVSTRPVTMIERGVCRDVVYDTPTALHDGVTSTGHSLPQPNTIGPWATHLLMEAGTTPVPELVAGVRRGLYVTRFWYVRVVHPLRTVITGMTREGTFLIQDGRLAAPVKDLRFTESIVGALSRVVAISDERRLELGEDGSSVLVPWVRLEGFRFTS
ncbi:MAG TPA: metallopeptidase TldD-related protein [Candidatus Dormibacteraeota bacterium]|nr:metallopeptidase TldD-related protein [Candidatus Dormibacteraeota bacterium]